jgi:dTDP-4-amino-4,6-dideoxygalactose transaminase
LQLIEYDPSSNPSYHYIVVEVSPDFGASRDRVVAALQAENILARRYFWPGCHGMKPYKDLFPHARLMLPNTETVADRIVVLPNGNALSEEGGVQVIGELLRVLGAYAA